MYGAAIILGTAGMTKSFDKIFTPKFWSFKRIFLVVGFVFAVIGTAGPYVWVDSLKLKADAVDREVRKTTEAITALQSSYFAYFFAAQQGAMIFVLDPGGTSYNRELLGNLYKANLLDRAIPFRFILGSLAFAKQIDYRKAYDKYVELNDNARAAFTPENYQAVKDFEGGIILQANDRIAALISQRSEKIEKKVAIDEEVERRRQWLVTIATIGLAVMLAANVTTTK